MEERGEGEKVVSGDNPWVMGGDAQGASLKSSFISRPNLPDDSETNPLEQGKGPVLYMLRSGRKFTVM